MDQVVAAMAYDSRIGGSARERAAQLVDGLECVETLADALDGSEAIGLVIGQSRLAF
ncbi:MAG: hypothetical protein H0W37_13055 [Pseudonocardiales bacterium]|nr:hypothetical protein [Pseudonocardiales bacterium]